VQVTLEAFRGGQPLQDHCLLFRGVTRPRAHGLETLLHPELLAGIDDVHVFGADGAAIGLLQRLDQFAELRGAAPEMKGSDVERFLEIRGRQVVVGKIEDRHVRPFHHASGSICAFL